MVQGTFSVHSKWQERLKSLRVTFFRKYFYVLLLYLQQSFGISEPETHFPSRVFMNILSQCVQCLMQSMNYCELSLCTEYVRQTSAAFLFNIVRNGDGIDLCCSLFTMDKNIWTFEYTHLHQGRFSLNIRKRWNSIPRAVVMKLSCQSSRRIWTTFSEICLIFGWFYVKPGFELDDPCGSLTTYSILWFCDPYGQRISNFLLSGIRGKYVFHFIFK